MNDATDDTTTRSNSTAPASSGARDPNAEAAAANDEGVAAASSAPRAAQAEDAPPAAEGEAKPPAQSVAPASTQATPASDPRADAERFKEQWMRSAADFDNFRKRARREVEDAKKSGREDLLRELLPVFDNLERGIQSAQRANDVKAVADGLGMILKQFIDTLGRAGITKVAGVGSPFDPAVHEAIQQVESKDQPPGVVIAEVQPGYVQGDRLVRAAMVVVSKAPANGGESTN